MGLSDGEIILMTRSAVLTQIKRVTERQTDGQTELAWHIRAIAYMLSRVKTHKNEHVDKTPVCRTVGQTGALTTALKPNKNEMQCDAT